MRFIRLLHFFLTFAYLTTAVPAPALQHGSTAPQSHKDLTEAFLKLTESRLDLRDAALAILERTEPLFKRSDGESHLDKRWTQYFPKPRPRGIQVRDDNVQIAHLLAHLEQSIVTVVQLISDQLGVPISTMTTPPVPCSLSTTTTSLHADRPITLSLPPLTTSEVTLTSLGPSTPATASSSSASSSIMSSNDTSYTFNASRPDLNIAYYAQSPATLSVPFLNVCSDPSVDIIILAFVTDFFTAGGYPTLNLASKCWGLDPNTALGAAATAKGATGLIDCISSGFASQVAQCQAAGKKVMLSLGGSKDYSNTAIPSPQKAMELADTLWSLFLGGTDPNLSPLRPFGANVILDGIDIGKSLFPHLRSPLTSADNENPANSGYLPILASTLRSIFQASHAAGSKPFYLSAAPQCVRPDLSIPIPSMLSNLDFVSVQFYNNPSCNLGTSGFIGSLKSWSSDIADYEYFHNVGNGLQAPRLLIGAPADPAAAGAGGYINQTLWQSTLQQIKTLRLPNLGGAMYWDGSYLELSKTKGAASADIVRSVL